MYLRITALLSLVLLTTIASAGGKSVTMPSQEIIHRRLSEQGLEDFIKKTNLPKTLAGRQLLPVSVARTLKMALHNYSQVNSNRQIDLMMEKREANILEVLLLNESEALKELARCSLYSPKKRIDWKQ